MQTKRIVVVFLVVKFVMEVRVWLHVLLRIIISESFDVGGAGDIIDDLFPGGRRFVSRLIRYCLRGPMKRYDQRTRRSSRFKRGCALGLHGLFSCWS